MYGTRTANPFLPQEKVGLKTEGTGKGKYIQWLCYLDTPVNCFYPLGGLKFSPSGRLVRGIVRRAHVNNITPPFLNDACPGQPCHFSGKTMERPTAYSNLPADNRSKVTHHEDRGLMEQEK